LRLCNKTYFIDVVSTPEIELAMAETWRSCWNDQQGEEQTYSNDRVSKPIHLGWKTRAFDMSDTDYFMAHHQLYI
jgi:hypothetical protein